MNLNNEGEKHVSITTANAATVLSPVGTATPASTVSPPVVAETAAAVIETSVNEVTIPSSSNNPSQNDNEPSSQIIQEDSNKVSLLTNHQLGTVRLGE